MEDHYRVVIVADTHIGANRRRWLHKMGVTSGQYQKPALEARTWARDNHADVFIVAGDLYDQRVPTPTDYLDARQLDPDLVVAGNHDIFALGSEDALWSMTDVMRGSASEIRRADIFGNPAIQIVGLPWPRPSDYVSDEANLSIPGEIEATRRALIARLKTIANDLNSAKPAIGIGHVMLSYGGDRAQPREDDIVILGKDIVIPHEDLLALPNIGGWYLGHVHKPGKGYVGSTQPTDWGDLGEKSFTVVDMTLSDNDAWVYETRQIPYTTSLKLAVVSDEDYDLDGDYDGVRLTWTLREGDDPEQLAIAERALRDQHPYVEVIIDREVKRVARVETPEPLSKMPVRAAALMWHENRETEPELRDATMAAFDAITGED
jgi:DNA repair exonuclease SbcCD nuclease subunit